MTILAFTSADGRAITINARRESTVIMENGDTSFTFDYEGRLIGAFLDGRNYRRSLANEILEKQSGPRPGLSGRLRRRLGQGEVRVLEHRAYAFAAQMLLQSGKKKWEASQQEREAVVEALTRVGSYSYERLEAEREQYLSVYKPVTILPPDQYLAVYLQAVEGCVYNHCRFCGFYRDRFFHVKTEDEFKQHLLDVRSFFRGGLALRRSIFLGDANALLIPQAELSARFDAINSQFAVLPRGLGEAGRVDWERAHPVHFNGIYSFVDAVESHRRAPSEYAELAARGLRRVYVGLETGDPALLRFLGKPHTPTGVLELINDLKAGGVAVGVIILIGAGGARYQETHIHETARLLNALPLDVDDLIYFSELIDYPGSTYAERAESAGITPLTAGEIEHQMVRLRSELSFTDPGRAPKVSFYDIREFVY